MKRDLLIIIIFMVVFIFFFSGCAMPQKGTDGINNALTNDTNELSDTVTEEIEKVNEVAPEVIEHLGLEEVGLKFDGVDDYVDLRFSPGFTVDDSFTFELWVKLLDEIDVSSAIIGPDMNQIGTYGFYSYQAGFIEFGLRYNSRDEIAHVGYKAFEVGRWYYLVGVYDSIDETATLYVNGETIGFGVLNFEESAELGRALSVNDLRINHNRVIRGARADAGHLNCIIREIRIWGKAFTEDDVRFYMLQNKIDILSTELEGLIGYWPMDEGKGSTIFDLSGNGNNGSILGARW